MHSVHTVKMSSFLPSLLPFLPSFLYQEYTEDLPYVIVLGPENTEVKKTQFLSSGTS